MKNWLFSFLLFSTCGFTQTDSYSVYLKPKQIPNLMGLQSFAFGQFDGKWVIIGGRLDGLHRRQPFAAFDSIGHNNHILVIDPQTNELWKAPVDGLTPSLRDQLKATNIGFVQQDNKLLLAGGYGINGSAEDHITFPYLTTVNLPDLIAAVQQQQLNNDLFQQTQDSLFAVTGGQLHRMNNLFYLIGGHRFDGRYNPADRPTFTQTYTNSVRRFYFNDREEPVFLPEFGDLQHMHRRDFNVVLSQQPSGELHLTAFSGVFQHEKDLPFLTTVHITPEGLKEQPGFRQYYNHYHCPDFSYFDPATGEMNTLFFGGIAQYYDSLGILLQDNDVPFVSTISRVVQRPDGSMTEYRLPAEMPALLGAGGEFIPNPQAGTILNGILQLEPGSDSLFIGTIIGGIASTARNIFWINYDAESAAASGMFDVYLVKSMVPQTVNEWSNDPLNLHVYHSAQADWYQLYFTLEKAGPVEIKWTNRKGKVKHKKIYQGKVGLNNYPKLLPKKQGTIRILLTVEGKKTELYYKVPAEG